MAEKTRAKNTNGDTGRDTEAQRLSKMILKCLNLLARPKGFEPLTPRFVVWCSIQLSYGCVLEARTYSGAFTKARTTLLCRTHRRLIPRFPPKSP